MDAYSKLLALLDDRGVVYRLIDHAPEGRTERASALRGHPLSQAVKCIVVMAKLGRKVTKYILAVVPGDARLDLPALKRLLGATYVAFAAADVAEELAGAVAGSILPFPFDDRLRLIVDPAVFEADELFFNAGRLDRSMALRSVAYREVASPQIARIALRDRPVVRS